MLLLFEGGLVEVVVQAAHWPPKDAAGGRGVVPGRVVLCADAGADGGGALPVVVVVEVLLLHAQQQPGWGCARHDEK